MVTYGVTGGTGFVGRALIKAIVSRGISVRALVRRYDEELASLGCQLISGTLSGDSTPFLQLVDGTAGVFHVGAKVDMVGSYNSFFTSNVLATSTLLDACQKAGVTKVVYTSSPSVVARPHHLRGVDERLPWAPDYAAAYPRTKAMAEGVLIQRARRGDVDGVILRPHLIFGPGDTGLSKAFLHRGRNGSLWRIGVAEPIVDFTYIDDCVEAHLLAMESLQSGAISGCEIFSISQGEPFSLWRWVSLLLAEHDIEPRLRTIPTSMARLIARVGDFLSPLYTAKPTSPPLTTFLCKELQFDHFFSIDKARTVLGFRPKWSITAGLRAMRHSTNCVATG